MHNSPFTVAGMSTSTGTHHNSNIGSWGSASTSGPLTSSFTDTLSQSTRSHYQAGYLMSSQNNNAPQGNQRADEVPVVQTKAKMNHVLSRSDFGMDSMFQSSRQRQTFKDEDAPPMNSVNDIPNESFDSSPARFQPRSSTVDGSRPPKPRHRTSLTQQTSQIVYVVVFGYPADKYSTAVEYFKSLGETTEVDQNIDIQNCFRIGYADPGDAMRAVRKNGEVLGGSWMVGAKWADPGQAEILLGQSTTRHTISSQPQDSNSMAVDDPSPSPQISSTPTVGTPIKLVPSTSAFRRTGVAEKPSTPQAPRGWGPSMPSVGPPAFPAAATAPPADSPNKGMLGQVSDLIFGW